MNDKFVERRIVTGLIVSTDYIRRVRELMEYKFLKTKAALRISSWCMSYFDKYSRAPGPEIESIFYKRSVNLSEGDAADIEDILANLSDNYEEDSFNVDYLYDQTVDYFDEQQLLKFVEDLQDNLDAGNLERAKSKAVKFIPPAIDRTDDLDLSSKDMLKAVDRAFTSALTPLFKYPRQLGRFLNDQLVSGGLIAFMGPEKRGKTFLLMDMGVTAVDQKCDVAFFQAGDMNEPEGLRRLAIRLSGVSNVEKYCQEHYEPVRDCWMNQNNTCDKKVRECNFGPFEGYERDEIRKITREEIMDKVQEFDDYKPCYNCSQYWNQKLGAVWLKKVPKRNPLSATYAKRVMKNFFIKKKRKFRLSTHANGTLTISKMENILDIWEKEDGFVPEIIIVDYVDIMKAEENTNDFRHKENSKWMGLRALSHKRRALVITATQTDADSYKVNTLSLNNFSEDKRKFAHVTAMYGINQDVSGREKSLGIMRLNEIVVREGAFSRERQVFVLQNLSRGQPTLSSYW